MTHPAKRLSVVRATAPHAVNPIDFKNVYVFKHPVSMRKGIDGLTGMILKFYGRSLFNLNGHMFLFMSADRKRAKAILIESSRTTLFYSRLNGKNYFPDIKLGERWTRRELMTFLNSPTQNEVIVQGD